MQPKVIAVCNPVTDHLVHVDKMPLANGGARLLQESYQYGGNAATGIVTVGRQGTPAGIVGIVGDDAEGRGQFVDFERHGVDTSHLIAAPGVYTPVVMCMSDKETGGRAFLGKVREGQRRMLQPEELDLDYIRGADYLMLDSNNETTRLAAKTMLDKGGEIMFDASSYSESQEAMLPYTTVYITSEFYLNKRYNVLADAPHEEIWECCRDMMAKGPHTVIFTLGGKGCVGVGPEGPFALPAFKIDVVDTTGAGDTFHGAYIYGMIRGWKAVDCARWASATSAFKCSAIGGRAGQPTAEVVQKFLDTGVMDLSWIPERVEYYSKPHY